MRPVLLTAGPGARRWLAVILMLVVPVLGFAASVQAQGTAGTLPDPISSRELGRYADVLDLSSEQRQAVESIHNKYRADFARLRDGEIEEYLSTHGGAGNFRINFDRSEVEKETRQMQDLLGRIRSVDERFFDQMLALLTESQQSLLPRIRQARQRQRYRSGLSLMGLMIIPAGQVDLSQMISELDIPVQAGSEVDLMLQQYETRLTSVARDLHDVSAKKGLLMFDRMAELGFGAEALEDPNAGQDMFQAMFGAMNYVQGKMRDQAAEIANFNRRTMRELAAVMPKEQVRQLRDRYYRQAYPDPAVSSRMVTRRFETALERDELNDQQRGQLGDMFTAYEQERLQSSERLMDALDEQGRTGFLINPSEEQETLRQKREKAVADARERCQGIDERTMVALDAVLGEDLAQRITQRIAQQDAESGEGEVTETRVMMITMAAGSDEGGVSEISTMSMTFSGDDLEPAGAFSDRGGIPTPVTTQDMDRIARRLELTEDERAIASALHDDYRGQFDEATAEKIGVLRELEGKVGGGAFRVYEEDAEPELPKESDVDQMFALRRELMRSVDEIDGQLFENVRTIITDEDRAQRVDRARMARRRGVYSKAGTGGGPGGIAFGGGGGMLTIGGSPNREESVDLASLMEELALSGEAASRVDPILFDYEQQITDVFRTRYEASQRVDEDMQRSTVRAMRQTAQGRRVEFSRDAEGFEAIEDKRAEARKATDRIVSLNRATLEQLTQALDRSNALQLRRAYDRAAFPGVFRDPKSLDEKLRAALALPDLNDSQRRDLRDLTAEHHAAYEECCQKMVEHHRGSMGGGDGEEGAVLNMQRLQERMRELEKLKFERNEVNDRTLTRLRALLTEEQARRIGAAETEEDR